MCTILFYAGNESNLARLLNRDDGIYLKVKRDIIVKGNY